MKKAKLDLGRHVANQYGMFRFLTGEWDPEFGIFWPTHTGSRVDDMLPITPDPDGYKQGVVIISGTWIRVETDEAQAKREAKEAEAKLRAAAAAKNAKAIQDKLKLDADKARALQAHKDREDPPSRAELKRRFLAEQAEKHPDDREPLPEDLADL